jgi:hypothetical protein
MGQVILAIAQPRALNSQTLQLTEKLGNFDARAKMARMA